MKRLEIVANLLIIVVCILLATVVVRNHILSFKAQRGQAAFTGGSRLALEGIDWKRNGKTVVLALTTECHFCTESAPFYRRLSERAAAANVPVVVISPQSVADVRTYLEKLAVPIADVRQVRFQALGLSVSPTIMLADRSGRRSRAWFGKLQASEEQKVLDALIK